MDKAKIIERIRALRAKTVENGCTEEEAAAAAEMIARLLEKYNLSAEECDIRENDFAEAEHVHDDLVGKRLWKIAAAISDMMDVRYWAARPGEIPKVTFFGFAHEVEIAGYLLDICRNAMKTQQERVERENMLFRENVRRRKVSAFLDGMADRLYQRIKDLKPKYPPGKGLVVLRNELIDAELADRGKTFNERQKARSWDLDENYEKGKKAADQVALNTGIKGRGSTRKLES